MPGQPSFKLLFIRINLKIIYNYQCDIQGLSSDKL